MLCSQLIYLPVVFDNDGDDIVEVLLSGDVAVEGIADVTDDVELFPTIPVMIALSVILHGVAVFVVDAVDINVVDGARDVVE